MSCIAVQGGGTSAVWLKHEKVEDGMSRWGGMYQHHCMQLGKATPSARLDEEYFNVGEEGVQKRGGDSHKSGRMFVRAGRSFEEHKEWSAAETKLGSSEFQRLLLCWHGKVGGMPETKKEEVREI